MGDNSEVLKAIRLMQNIPKYWILSSRAVLVGSNKDGSPILPPDSECFRDKIVLTIPEEDPTTLLEWISAKQYDGYYKWEYTGTCDNMLDLSDLSKEYDKQYKEEHEDDNPDIKCEIEEQIKADKAREQIFEFQKEHQKEVLTNQNSGYTWEWTPCAGGWYNGSDAGYFQLDYKQAEISNRIFNNASTANIGHDKENIEDILTASSTSTVKSDSISKKLKYMEMKEKKYGKTMTQNITINGDNNTVIGISINQSGEDDCEQTQTVVIKNSKSEKKKEKKESVFGVLHRALINLAKIVELSTQYLLEYVRDIFFG